MDCYFNNKELSGVNGSYRCALGVNGQSVYCSEYSEESEHSEESEQSEKTLRTPLRAREYYLLFNI